MPLSQFNDRLEETEHNAKKNESEVNKAIHKTRGSSGSKEITQDINIADSFKSSMWRQVTASDFAWREIWTTQWIEKNIK